MPTTTAKKKKRLIPTVSEIPGTVSLPAFIEDIYPKQWKAVQRIKKAYEDGAKVVFLDAPTGTGKTLIGELVRRIVNGNGKTLYLCHTKSLQDQLVHDYDYVKLLKGRQNYPTQLKPFPEVTAAECTKTETSACKWCESEAKCPYKKSKAEALAAPFTTTNLAYFLNEANFAGRLAGRDLVIADECDTLEDALKGFIEFTISERMLRQLKLDAPKKGSHKKTIRTWLVDEFAPAAQAELRRLGTFGLDSPQIIRQANGLSSKIEDAERIADEIGDDNWTRSKADGLVLKPTFVSRYAKDYLWTHAEKWLCMSASIISVQEMADSLGLDRAGIPYDIIQIPSSFPRRNRPVIFSKVAKMTKKEIDGGKAIPDMAKGINAISQANPSQNILVHTHSYPLTKELVKRYKGPHTISTYKDSSSRQGVVDQLKLAGTTNPIITFAPSLDRGIDLPDDLCRIQILAKVPYPYLGDRQISDRLHGRNGQAWYTTQTVRTVLQMTGRGVRHREDWAVTYILDKSFARLYGEAKNYFPEWWLEAFQMVRPDALDRNVIEIVRRE